MKKLGMAVMAGLVLTAGVVFTASKSDGDVLREVRDRQEIEDLTWRYITAIVAGGANTPLRVAGRPQRRRTGTPQRSMADQIAQRRAAGLIEPDMDVAAGG